MNREMYQNSTWSDKYCVRAKEKFWREEEQKQIIILPSAEL
jgi:hypothetical protein